MLGLRVPPANFLLALIVLALMVLLGVSISYALAIFVPNETTLANLTNGVAQPLSLLAGVLIPLSVAPLWVQDVALWNPFAWATNGMRAIFLGHIGAQVVWEAGVILAGVAVGGRACCRHGCSPARSHEPCTSHEPRYRVTSIGG